MKHKIIGIAGPAQVGKDTTANIIQNILAGDWEIKSFADPMKQMLALGLGLTNEQLYGKHKEVIVRRYECTPRHIMQTIGTEWGRKLIHHDIWVHAMSVNISAPTIIPDVRFENEAVFVRENGILIHVEGRGGIEGCHVSEDGVKHSAGDVIIRNGGDIDYLHILIAGVLTKLSIERRL